MRQIESLQIVPIVPENREDVSKAPKVSSISAESTMSVVFAEVVTKLLPYLQRIIDIAEHKHVCKHASQLPRHLAGYSLSGQVNPKLVGGNETTSNTCFLKSVMNNAIHRFEIVIPSCTRNVEKKKAQMNRSWTQELRLTSLEMAQGQFLLSLFHLFLFLSQECVEMMSAYKTFRNLRSSSFSLNHPVSSGSISLGSG